MATTPITFTVVAAERAPKFYAGCVGCGHIICEGEFAIVYTIDDRHYMMGKYPRETCCGAEVNIPFLFCSKPEARRKMTEVMEQIQTDARKYDAFSYFPIESFFAQEIH